MIFGLRPAAVACSPTRLSFFAAWLATEGNRPFAQRLSDSLCFSAVCRPPFSFFLAVMSIVFVVGSEDQLSSGMPWCKRIAQTSGASIHALVVGRDSKVLLEHTRRKMSDELDQPIDSLAVEAVEPDLEAVLLKTKAARCSTLVMVYGSDASELQQPLFESCRAPALWLQVSGPPPATATRLFAAMARNNATTSSVSEKLFGFEPPAVLPDPFEGDEEPVGEVVEKVTAEIDASANQLGDLVLVGIDNPSREDPVYAVGLKLLENNCPTSLALVHDGESLKESLGAQIQDWAASVAPPMVREQRRQLSIDLEEGSKPNLEFLGLISASAMLAAFGLLQDSAAVIIGAMLIAPLMTPILGAGLALTHGNRPLFQSALVTISMGFLCALIASAAFGLLVRLLQEGFQIPLMEELASTREMLARCRPSPLDFCVGLVGGMAASYARTRSHLSSALAGAAIAAALVPPIATAGLEIAFGEWGRTQRGETPVLGPLLLVSVNVLTIMIGSSFILWARGMRADRKLPAKARWAPRMVALLMLLALLALVSVTLPA